MSSKMISVCIVAMLVIVALFSVGATAFAYTASASGNYTFTVWYAGNGLLMPYSCMYNAYLSNTYEVYATDPRFWKIYNHNFGGTYYVANNSTYPFSQKVVGSIVFYNNGAYFTGLGLTKGSSIYPSGWLPWGGYNTANVFLPKGGTDYVAGQSSWSSSGQTSPATVSRTVKYYY